METSVDLTVNDELKDEQIERINHIRTESLVALRRLPVRLVITPAESGLLAQRRCAHQHMSVGTVNTGSAT
jgi:hypothetical protein